MIRVLCAVVILSLMTGCASVNEGRMGFVCERVYRKDDKPPSTTDNELERELSVPKSKLKCSGKKLFWFRVKFNT